MSAVMKIVALAGVLSTVACGATTSGSSGGTNAPIYTPPSSGRPTTTANTTPTEVNSSAYGVVPASQELDVRLGTTLSSKTAKVEQRFEATTVADVTQNGMVLHSRRIDRSRRRLGGRSRGSPPPGRQPDAVVR